MKHCDWPGLDGVLIPTLREQPPRLQSSTEGESEVRSGRPRAPRGCCHKKEGCMLAQRKQEKPATRCRKWKNFRKSQGRKQSPAIVLPGRPSLRDPLGYLLTRGETQSSSEDAPTQQHGRDSRKNMRKRRKAKRAVARPAFHDPHQAPTASQSPVPPNLRTNFCPFEYLQPPVHPSRLCSSTHPSIHISTRPSYRSLPIQ